MREPKNRSKYNAVWHHALASIADSITQLVRNSLNDLKIQNMAQPKPDMAKPEPDDAILDPAQVDALTLNLEADFMDVILLRTPIDPAGHADFFGGMAEAMRLVLTRSQSDLQHYHAQYIVFSTPDPTPPVKPKSEVLSTYAFAAATRRAATTNERHLYAAIMKTSRRAITHATSLVLLQPLSWAANAHLATAPASRKDILDSLRSIFVDNIVVLDHMADLQLPTMAHFLREPKAEQPLYQEALMCLRLRMNNVVRSQLVEEALLLLLTTARYMKTMRVEKQVFGALTDSYRLLDNQCGPVTQLFLSGWVARFAPKGTRLADAALSDFKERFELMMQQPKELHHLHHYLSTHSRQTEIGKRYDLESNTDYQWMQSVLRGKFQRHVDANVRGGLKPPPPSKSAFGLKLRRRRHPATGLG